MDKMCSLLTTGCQITLRMTVTEVDVDEKLITSMFGTLVALG
jgi:hypothetical protein